MPSVGRSWPSGTALVPPLEQPVAGRYGGGGGGGRRAISGARASVRALYKGEKSSSFSKHYLQILVQSPGRALQILVQNLQRPAQWRPESSAGFRS